MLAIVVTVTSLVSVATADAGASPIAQLASTPLEAEARAEPILSAVRDGSMTGALRALLEASGLDARPYAIEAAPPVAMVLDAITTAEQLRVDALAALTPRERTILRAAAMSAEHVVPAHPGGAGALLETNGLRRHPDAERIAAKVDERALRDAAVTLVNAIERAAPALAILPSTPLAPSTCGATGDMLFETSDCAVMIAGTGENGYPVGVDPLLLVDLGGNDTYENGAARASGNVRVVVDVAGNDTYTTTAASTTPGGPVTHAAGQGAGVLGVAVLADLDGSDRYTLDSVATAPEPGPVAPTAQVTGQGAAIAGAGVLIDLGGDDDIFDASASSTGGAALALAQGQSTIGVGALLALGDGTDADIYRANARSTLHSIQRTEGFERFAIGNAEAVAHGGTNLAGVAALADAVGDDVYEARATGAAGRAIAQGGSVGGAALLVDGTGSDTMLAEAIGDATLSLITTDPTVCWTATVIVTTSATSAIGQGGAFGGVAALLDGMGNDERTLLASSSAEAISEARSNHVCDSFGGNTARATARTGDGDATGQGAALLGVGVLLDVMGTDANHLDVAASSIARAIAISPGIDVEDAVAEAGTALAQGQAFSAVGLTLDADLGGVDARTSRASTFVSRTTSAGTVSSATPGTIRVHGWVNGGRAYLLDIGGTDAYGTDPAGVSAAANDACWSNTPDGRGIDWVLGPPLPVGCL